LCSLQLFFTILFLKPATVFTSSRVNKLTEEKWLSTIRRGKKGGTGLSKRFDTETVHFPKKLKGENVSKSQPIYQTSAFTFEDLDEMESYFESKKDYFYTRMGNPNTNDLAGGIANLEKTPLGAATSSGISAILAGVLSVVQNGDHIVACEDIYGGTYQLLAHELLDFGIEVTFAPFSDWDEVEAAIKPNTKLLYSESVTNPLLRVENLDKMVEVAKKNDLVTMIDNTFASPFLLQPYTHGVDIVVHSATKYIGGHSDVTAGVLAGKEAYIAKAKAKMTNLGLNLGPFDGWLASRGLKTLSVRMEKHNQNAAKLADFFKENTDINKVFYPEFVSPKGNGAIVTVGLGQRYDVKKFFQNLSWIKIVPTLAGAETSVSYPLGTSHRSVPEETRNKLGITPDIVRISIGIEDAEDIIEAFSEALKKSFR
jgi:cystathionine beta-lyase/cystathionine gamma-synthase